MIYKTKYDIKAKYFFYYDIKLFSTQINVKLNIQKNI